MTSERLYFITVVKNKKYWQVVVEYKFCDILDSQPFILWQYV